jgi:hypothetical protein
MMRRSDVYVKVEVALEDDENPQKLALEICRQIERVYGVRKAEVQNIVECE